MSLTDGDNMALPDPSGYGGSGNLSLGNQYIPPGASAPIGSFGANHEFARVVVENLTLDGNWEGQTNYIGPDYPRSLKVQPLNIGARTGRLRKVIVR